jgi:hypothetical protein
LEAISKPFFVILIEVKDLNPLGTVSSRLSGISDPAAWIIGIAGGVFVSLAAAYLGREILSPDQERLWIKACSMAEALKAEIFLFRSGATPYDAADPAPKLMGRVQEYLATVEDYISERLDDQVEHLYRPRVQQYDRLMKRWRNVNLALGALAAVLGVLGKWTGAWVAVITTVHRGGGLSLCQPLPISDHQLSGDGPAVGVSQAPVGRQWRS